MRALTKLLASRFSPLSSIALTTTALPTQVASMVAVAQRTYRAHMERRTGTASRRPAKVLASLAKTIIGICETGKRNAVVRVALGVAYDWREIAALVADIRGCQNSHSV
jgi:hypothetical protein